MVRHILLAVLLALAATVPASGQRLVGAVSERQIEITSDFVGQTLTLFGNVEPAIGAADTPVRGPFHVVIVVTGPVQDRVVRQQTNRFVIWLNTDSHTFRAIPSYKWVLASAPLDLIAEPQTLSDNHISLASTGDADEEAGTKTFALFQTQLIRLMTDQRLYGLDETGVQFRSPTLYSARLELPGDVPNGTFLAETFLFRNGEIVARETDRFVVRKAGLERLLGDSARDYPLYYGLFAVALALATGWLGGVVFKR